MISPVVKDLAHEYKDEVLFGKLDVDADSNPGVAREYCLMSISTLLVFKRGQVIDRVVGAIPKNVLEEKIRAQL
jgi:thioredoxin 1